MRKPRGALLVIAVLGSVALFGCSSSSQPESADGSTASSSSSLAPTTTPTTPAPPRTLVRANPRDDVFAFGTPFHGSTGRQRLAARIVDLAATPTGNGYWLLGADGGVFTFGDARFHGAGTPGDGTYVGIAPTRSGSGYWLATTLGRVRAFGDATEHGSLTSLPAPRAVVGIDTAQSGRGYWLAAADGAVWGYGDANGAPNPRRLNEPIVAIAAAARGDGYFLAGGDDGVFAADGARFAGSSADEKLRAPIVDIASAPSGRAYWLVGADGGVFSFGGRFAGSAARIALGEKRVVAVAAHPTEGYWIARGAPNPPPPAQVPPRAPVMPRPAPANPGPTPTPTPTGPSQPVPAPTVPAQPQPPPSGGVLAIGDSVMLGAASALGGIPVDATVSRQFSQLPGVLASYRDQGRLPGTIVVHLGTNGTVSGGDLDVAMQIAAGRRVVFVNVWVPRSWEGQSNASISSGVARWPNARLGDWRSIAARGGMVVGDGHHMSAAGAQAYAAMIRNAIG